MNENLPVRIAVLENSFLTVSEQMREHDRRDDDRFDRMFKFITEMKKDILESMGDLDDKFTEKFANLDDKIDTKVDPLETKVDTLWDEKNQRKGAMKLSNIAAHCATGLVSICVALGIRKLW